MKNYFKKFSVMLITALILSLGLCVSAFADGTSQSIKINNTALNFNKIIYVDGTNGNDLTGDGSTENPYQSITKAQSVSVDGNAIYIRKGTYNLSSTGNGLYETKHKLSFIGEPNGTIIVSDGTKNTVRDNHAAAFNVDCSVYNIIFKYTAGNRATNYSCALVGNGFDMETQQYGKFYNCLFIATDKAPAPCYGNKDINVKFNNCSFIIPDNFQKTYIMYGADKTQWLNCAESKNAYETSTTCLGNLNFSNVDYNIISNGWKNTGTGTNPDGTQANIGVYGGEFAWGNWDNKSISLDKSSMNLTVGDSQQLTATTTPAAVEVTWKSSDSSIATVDSTGKVTGVKEGTCTITATTADGLTATCAITVTPKTTEPTNPDPDPTDSEKIVNIAHAKGDNTNNAGGDVTIIFHGAADTTLSVVKTADVKDVWVGDNFTYTIVVTNTGTKTAKAVVVNDPAPNHIDFLVNGVTSTQGKIDPSSTSKNIIVNVGDILPGGTVTIKIPATVIL